jgi:XTP/dITP diphosphohydrolase
MQPLLYITGNQHKFVQAQHVCDDLHLELKQDKTDFIEIQSDKAEDIARYKAQQAFEKFKQAVVVSDDSWLIPALGGFPGPYMKYVNDWFTTQNWLDLTKPLQDRRIILDQTIVYQDTSGQQLFNRQLEGQILHEARGEAIYPHTAIITFDGGKHTNAELHQQNLSATAHLPNVWRDFAEWYSKQHA